MTLKSFKSLITIYFSLLFLKCPSQNKTSISQINLKDYKQSALAYIDTKYDEVSKIADSSRAKFANSLLACQFSKKDLEVYSCPIFKIKRMDSIIYKNKNFVASINFKNDYNKQIIKIYNDAQLICEHLTDANYHNNKGANFDEFNFIQNNLLIYKEDCLPGIPDTDLSVYSSKIKFEKTGLLFFVKGIKTSFYHKDATFYAIKIVNKKRFKRNRHSFEKFLSGLEAQLIPIEEFVANLKLSDFYDQELAQHLMNRFK